MKSTSALSSLATALRAVVLSVAFVGSLSTGSSAIGIGANVLAVKGSATTTVTSLVFDPLGTTISIQSEQVGFLTNIGAFTAKFSYLAVPSPATIVIAGSGTIATANGDKLHATASILELGTDYPRTLNGTLTITGGTGKYAGATGVLTLSGVDEASLTDTIDITGVITVVQPLLPLGLLK